MPGSPSSSPMMAKMKSLWASESHFHFSLEPPRLDPPPAAVGEGVEPWTDCPHQLSGSDWQSGRASCVIRVVRLLLE